MSNCDIENDKKILNHADEIKIELESKCKHFSKYDFIKKTSHYLEVEVESNNSD